MSSIITMRRVAGGCLSHSCSTVRMHPVVGGAAQDARRVTGDTRYDARRSDALRYTQISPNRLRYMRRGVTAAVARTSASLRAWRSCDPCGALGPEASRAFGGAWARAYAVLVRCAPICSCWSAMWRSSLIACRMMREICIWLMPNGSPISSWVRSSSKRRRRTSRVVAVVRSSDRRGTRASQPGRSRRRRRRWCPAALDAHRARRSLLGATARCGRCMLAGLRGSPRRCWRSRRPAPGWSVRGQAAP